MAAITPFPGMVTTEASHLVPLQLLHVHQRSAFYSRGCRLFQILIALVCGHGILLPHTRADIALGIDVSLSSRYPSRNSSIGTAVISVNRVEAVPSVHPDCGGILLEEYLVLCPVIQALGMLVPILVSAVAYPRVERASVSPFPLPLMLVPNVATPCCTVHRSP